MAARGVVETILVSNHANVRKSTEEHERTKFEVFFFRRRCEAREEIASTDAFKADPRSLKNTPDKS